jgi:hypothetical protein
MPRAYTVDGEKRKLSAAKEHAKVAALAEYLKWQSGPPCTRKSLREVGRSYGISPATLGRLAKGHPTMAQFNAKKQLLTAAEETELEAYIINQAKRGFPLTHRMVTNLAWEILAARADPAAGEPKIGAEWVYRFLKRHPKIGRYRATPLEKVRANGLHEAAVNDYWDTLKELFTDHHFPASNILGYDETGINLGVGGRPIVLGAAGQRNQHLQTNGTRENITVIETICADGTKLRPTMIFRGKYFMTSWGAVNPDSAK